MYHKNSFLQVFNQQKNPKDYNNYNTSDNKDGNIKLIFNFLFLLLFLCHYFYI